MKSTEGARYKLRSYGHEILVRPKFEGETFPTHTSHRILFGDTIVTVAGCDKYVLAQALVYEPEKKWKKCPACRQTNWSVWVPLATEFCNFFAGEFDKDFTIKTEWTITCRHCGVIVDRIGNYKLYSGQPTEYIYDPSQNEPFLVFSQRNEQRKKKR